MRKRLILFMIVILSFAGGYMGKMTLMERKTGGPGDVTSSALHPHIHTECRRIVSLAPSITEILFALDLGDSVVGVTRYARYPPAVLTRTKIGGYYDPGYEAIIALNPDLVIMLPEHEEPARYLGNLGLNLLVVNHRDISGILNSITAIGKVCGAEQKAMDIVRNLRGRIERIRHKTYGLNRPRVMISVGRNMGSGSLRDVYISGRGGFYDEMIRIAGGVNAYTGDIAFPVISGEGIARMNPDVIIDMVPDLDQKGLDKTLIIKEWEKNLPDVDAVRNDRVYVFGEDYVVIPGPRLILIIEEMARAIHPELDWE